VTVVPPPAEWAPHDAVWIGFPSHPELWEEDLDPAREEVVAFARAVHAGGRGETVILVAADAEAGNAASRMAPFAEVVVEPFGDIWLRDTGPILLGNGEACDFGFNGWGGKYDLPGDDTIGMRLAKRHGRRVGYCNWVLEGGAIDGDGTGVVDRLTKVVWLGDGLLNDHTDGHVDNLARFVGEGRLALPEAAENDPNWQVYQHALRDARAAGLEVVTIPSPGRVLRDEEVVPASYMNFYIGNAAVVVPLYGAENDAAAVRAVQALFPDREAVGLRADHILTGGGSFHCISQQIPAGV
jgi:agmatine deiminase